MKSKPKIKRKPKRKPPGAVAIIASITRALDADGHPELAFEYLVELHEHLAVLIDARMTPVDERGRA